MRIRSFLVPVLCSAAIVTALYFHVTPSTEDGFSVTGRERTVDSKGRPHYWVHITSQTDAFEVSEGDYGDFLIGAPVQLIKQGCGENTIKRVKCKDCPTERQDEPIQVESVTSN